MSQLGLLLLLPLHEVLRLVSLLERHQVAVVAIEDDVAQLLLRKTLVHALKGIARLSTLRTELHLLFKFRKVSLELLGLTLSWFRRPIE